MDTLKSVLYAKAARQVMANKSRTLNKTQLSHLRALLEGSRHAKRVMLAFGGNRSAYDERLGQNLLSLTKRTIPAAVALVEKMIRLAKIDPQEDKTPLATAGQLEAISLRIADVYEKAVSSYTPEEIALVRARYGAL